MLGVRTGCSEDRTIARLNLGESGSVARCLAWKRTRKRSWSQSSKE